MEVRHDEGVAIHIGPEPCVVGREANDQASAGEGTGQPLSRDRNVLGADAVEIAEGNMVEPGPAAGDTKGRGQGPRPFDSCDPRSSGAKCAQARIGADLRG